jgi:hypothetical protein
VEGFVPQHKNNIHSYESIKESKAEEIVFTL